MSYQIDNQEIGIYISGLIEREFKSARQFCRAYLQADGINEPTRDDIQNMANRLSQIKKGANAIQSGSITTPLSFFRRLMPSFLFPRILNILSNPV